MKKKAIKISNNQIGNSGYYIRKSLNKFVFIGEICSARNNPWSQERARQWLKASGGGLSSEERLQLKEFAGILSNFNFNLIEAYFVVSEGNELWDVLSEEIGAIKADKFKKIFKSFTPRFNILWQQEEPHLMEIRKYLNSQSKKIESALMVINKLSGIKNNDVYHKQVLVHLVISSKRRKDMIGWFSVLNNRTDIVLECSGAFNYGYDFLILILLHEFFHLALRKNEKIKNQIRIISKKNRRIFSNLSKEMTPAQVLEESLVSSFVPEGCLAVEYFGRKIKRVNCVKKKNNAVDFVSVRQFCAYKSRRLAKEYINAGKVLDENYLVFLTDVIKKGSACLRTTC